MRVRDQGRQRGWAVRQASGSGGSAGRLGGSKRHPVQRLPRLCQVSLEHTHTPGAGPRSAGCRRVVLHLTLAVAVTQDAALAIGGGSAACWHARGGLPGLWLLEQVVRITAALNEIIALLSSSHRSSLGRHGPGAAAWYCWCRLLLLLRCGRLCALGPAKDGEQVVLAGLLPLLLLCLGQALLQRRHRRGRLRLQGPGRAGRAREVRELGRHKTPPAGSDVIFLVGEPFGKPSLPVPLTTSASSLCIVCCRTTASISAGLACTPVGICQGRPRTHALSFVLP